MRIPPGAGPRRTGAILRAGEFFGGVMLDLVYLGVALVFFLAAAALVRGCARL